MAKVIGFMVVIGFSLFGVLHARHALHVHTRHVRHIRFLSTTNAIHDFVVFIGRQNADKGHHALHESAPSRRQSVVLRLVDHLVHRHHGTFHVCILREPRNRVGVLRDLSVHRARVHFLHTLLGVLLRDWAVRFCKIVRRPETHAAPQTGTVVFSSRNYWLAGEHSHSVFHVYAGRNATTNSGHWPDTGRHLIHHVVGQMTMQHPVARIVGHKLEVARLSDSDENGIAGIPRRFGNASSLGSGDCECVTVQMNRVMVHAKIHESHANSVAEAND